jgi:tRNA pseudouridine13 synthase
MKFRQSPDTFRVEEVPLFEPCGHGDHAYLAVARSGLSTPFLLKSLQLRAKLSEEEIGCAGMKDREAQAVQTFSVPARAAKRAEEALLALGCQLLSVRLHTHKLRTGKLAGNRFLVTLELEAPQEASALGAACERLQREGLPNAFGPQRFADGSAVEEGRRLFLGTRRRGGFRGSRFALSVFQSLLFNEILALRRCRNLYPAPVPGDLMKRHDLGGEFLAREVNPELLRRVEAFEISPAGPIFGGKMARAEKVAWEIEQEVLAAHGLGPASVTACRAPGARRFLRVPTGPISLEFPSQGQARLSFSLPPGSYASVLLAEAGVEVVKPAPER